MQYIDHFLNLIHSSTFCVYWLFYLGYLFITAYLGMTFLTEDRKITGWLLLLGAAGLLAGIFYAPLSALPFVWIVPLTAWCLFRRRNHLFYNLLYCSLVPVLLLAMNSHYGIL